MLVVLAGDMKHAIPTCTPGCSCVLINRWCLMHYSAVDSNFVDADWDAEDTTITLSKAPQPRNQSSGGGGGAGNK